MEGSPCETCPARCALFDLANEMDGAGNEARDRMRAACRAAGVDPLLETALAGPAPGGDLPNASNTDVSRYEPEYAWLRDMNPGDAIRAVFRLCLDLSDALLYGQLAEIDAGLLRELADILPNACPPAGPGKGLRVPLFGLVRLPGMQKIKCASPAYAISAYEFRKKKRRHATQSNSGIEQEP